MEFTWIPFYSEFANKLMDFRHNRKSLLDLIEKNRDDLPVSYMHDQGGQGDPLTDVDPFTVIGMLNRNISFDKRIKTIQVLKDLLGLTSPVPDDFNGVPRLMNTNSLFFGFRGSRGEEDIENLWILFEKVIQDEKDEDIEEIFNKVIQQFSIKIKITMGLFWIRPDRFLAFDRVNRAFVGKNFGIMLPETTPEYKLYQEIIASVREKMGSQGNVEYPFAELSANAHQAAKGSKDTSKDNSTDYRINLWKRRKNLVLQGAPGTGKTYQVPELVVRLCCPDAVWNSREELLARYNQLKNDRRVMFTTFHAILTNGIFTRSGQRNFPDDSVIGNTDLFANRHRSLRFVAQSFEDTWHDLIAHLVVLHHRTKPLHPVLIIHGLMERSEHHPTVVLQLVITSQQLLS